MKWADKGFKVRRPHWTRGTWVTSTMSPDETLRIWWWHGRSQGKYFANADEIEATDWVRE